MDQVKIGKFIASCRKEKQLTQVQLAQQLNITNRAVSKWETGKSMPDSSIMLDLCDILDISVNELLSSEKMSEEVYESKVNENLISLKKEEENNTHNNHLKLSIFSLMNAIGILICIICDVAVFGKLTWSLIPLISIILAWVLTAPLLARGKKGILLSLIFVSILIVPYFYFLSKIINVPAVFNIGSILSLITIIYLWLIIMIFNLLKIRFLIKMAVTLLITTPFVLVVNIAISKMILEPVIDVWDIFSLVLLLIAALILFVVDYVKINHRDRLH